MEQTFEREVLDRLKTIEIKMDSYGDVKAKTCGFLSVWHNHLCRRSIAACVPFPCLQA